MNYQRPPILEAIIAISFAEPIEIRVVERATEKLKKTYPNIKKQRAATINLSGAEPSVHREDTGGFRLADQQEQNIAIIDRSTITTSVLAPYPGWDGIRSRSVENFELLKDITGYRKIARVGIRYINRIDIPMPEGGHQETLDYVTIAPFAPRTDYLNSTEGYFLNMASKTPDGFLALIQTGIANPVILGHMSLMLDIDLIRDSDLPQKDDELWSLVDRMRATKNEIFELAITDKARELFNQ